MSLPRYESYKDSGIEWLGEVPEHWEIKQIRYLIKQGSEGMKIGPFGSQLTSQMLVESGCKVYGQENVIANDFSRGDRFITDDKLEELSVYEILTGDILITMMGTSGRCAIVPENIKKGVMDSHLIRIRVSHKVLPDFLQILIDESSYIAHQTKLLGKGSIMHGLNSSIIRALTTALPPIAEQILITDFLDQETAKIDNLIAEQQQLIKLLKEKRQVVISHAVTKGLNPDVPMKDSGVEWLGEVPEHWSLVPLKVLISKIESGKSVNAIDVPAEANEIGVLKTSCVYGGKFNPSENKTVIDAEINLVSCPLKEGMLIVSRMNTPELVGATGYVSNAPHNIYLPDRLWQIHFDKTNEKFRLYVIYSGKK